MEFVDRVWIAVCVFVCFWVTSCRPAVWAAHTAAPLCRKWRVTCRVNNQPMFAPMIPFLPPFVLASLLALQVAWPFQNSSLCWSLRTAPLRAAVLPAWLGKTELFFQPWLVKFPKSKKAIQKGRWVESNFLIKSIATLFYLKTWFLVAAWFMLETSHNIKNPPRLWFHAMGT